MRNHNIFLKKLILSAASWMLVHIRGFSASEEVIVLIQVERVSVASARAELNDARKSGDAEAMERLFIGGKTIRLAEFKQRDPWREEPIRLSVPTGVIDFGKGAEYPLAADMTIEGLSAGSKVSESLISEIQIPAGGKRYREYRNLGNSMSFEVGRWRERACWGNKDGMVMLWQFTTSDSPKKEDDPHPPAIRSMRVEMRWFDVDKADVRTVSQSKPETREKAMLWLAERATLWKEGGFIFGSAGKSVWETSEGSFDLVEGEAIPRGERMVVIGDLPRSQGSGIVEWDIRFEKKRGEEARELKLPMTFNPNVWEFIPVDGIPGANLLACRLSEP